MFIFKFTTKQICHYFAGRGILNILARALFTIVQIMILTQDVTRGANELQVWLLSDAAA